MGNILFSAFLVPDNLNQFILPIILLLFIIWLVHRLERRAVEEVIYKNFPFFKEAVNNFQEKLNYMDLRLGDLDNRISRLEQESQPKRGAF